MPNPEKLKQQKSLQFLGDRLNKPDLWNLNRRSVSIAFAIGLFVAWVPTVGQMAIAAVMALYLRANLPISVALVWITNPLTMPPMFYFAYYVGTKLLGTTPTLAGEFTLESALESLGDIGMPFLLGCLVLGVISASIGYFGMLLYWKYQVQKRWFARKK